MKTLFFHSKPSNESRITFAGIYEKDKLHIGISVCSNKDMFCKKNGRERAEKRAMFGKFHNKGSIAIGIQKDVPNNNIRMFVNKCANLIAGFSTDELKSKFNLRKNDN